MKQILPNCLDGLFVLFSVQEGGVHFKHPLIWCGWVLWVIQSSAAVQVAAVHLHGIYGSVRVWAGAGWLYKCANVRFFDCNIHIDFFMYLGQLSLQTQT